MDFFERQDQARRHTKLLGLYFAAAVLSFVIVINIAAALILGAFAIWPKPELLLWITLATLAVILAGSIFKTLQLASGGSAVAELLGGRLIECNTSDADERKLLDIVEEMSIASGVPVPQVYVMDSEPGINAFPAGYSTSDAAISVTRGCMKLLSRDELQGVIAHEFSHILNGDMRLNLRLIGLVFGILCPTVIGRVMLRTHWRKNPLSLIGVPLIVLGWPGVFFGRLIQAAISRHRELSVDAAAVQFTRNPTGLAGALKKIGGLAYGSQIRSPHAEETSHLFFANGMGDLLFATHPPLTDRVRALDPSFDGKFPRVMEEAASGDLSAMPISATAEMALPKVEAGRFALPFVAERAVIANVGHATMQHLAYAADLRHTIPPAIEAAARDPLGASGLVCALLLASEPSVQEQQFELLAGVTSEPMLNAAARIWREVRVMPVQAKIPALDLALPALRRLPREQFQQFRAAIGTLAASNAKADLFAYMLQKIVARHLDTYFVPERRPVTQFYALHPLARDCGVLLSATAYAGQENATELAAAFAKGAEHLGRAAHCDIPLLPPDDCDLSNMDAALERLSQAVPQIKKDLLGACAQTVAADGVIQQGEAELLRALADALDCPVPPFVQPEEVSAGSFIQAQPPLV